MTVNPLKNIVLLIITFAMSGACFAEFSIDYTGEQSKPKAVLAGIPAVTSSKKLLLDNSVQLISTHGKCESEKVIGSGDSVAFPSAMRMILPSGWRVFADESVILDNAQISWSNGDEWSKVISNSADRLKLKVEVNCTEKSISFFQPPSRGIYSETKAFELDSSIEPKPIARSVAGDSTSSELNGSRIAKPAPQAIASGSVSVDPYQNETVNSFAERYASVYGYDRVAYKILNVSKVLREEIDPKELRASKEAFDFESALLKRKLFKIDGFDVVSGAKILVITDTNHNSISSVNVYNVEKGMLSDNAILLAERVGKSIGDINIWPLDEDFPVPFSYDIVGATGLDLFLELFKSFPVQAQFIAGQKVINVVKRDTANRN